MYEWYLFHLFYLFIFVLNRSIAFIYWFGFPFHIDNLFNIYWKVNIHPLVHNSVLDSNVRVCFTSPCRRLLLHLPLKSSRPLAPFSSKSAYGRIHWFYKISNYFIDTIFTRDYWYMILNTFYFRHSEVKHIIYKLI